MWRFLTMAILLLMLTACGGGSGTGENADAGNSTSSTGNTSTSSKASYWQPVSPLRWQIQFTQTLDTTLNVDIYEFDGFDITAATISSLHQQGKKIICYIDAGTLENWRSDASNFPASVLGNTVAGSSGKEQWLDITQLSVLEPLMNARFDMIQGKGCDGVDADNVDEFTYSNTGFTITGGDQITYNQFLANAAHARNMAIGLKNDMTQIPALIGDFDYAINESCFAQGNCSSLQPFLNAGKPVFNIEYSNVETTSQFCPQANQMNFNSILKDTALDATVSFCR